VNGKLQPQLPETDTF